MPEAGERLHGHANLSAVCRRAGTLPSTPLCQVWTPNSRAIRRDEHERYNRKLARIQYGSDRLLWCKRVSVRSLKVRLQPLHQYRLHPGR